MTASEVVPSKQTSLSTDEHELALRHVYEMVCQDLAQEGWQRERAPAALGIHFLDLARLVATDLFEASDNRHLTTQDIEVVAFQSDELAPCGSRDRPASR